MLGSDSYDHMRMFIYHRSIRTRLTSNFEYEQLMKEHNKKALATVGKKMNTATRNFIDRNIEAVETLEEQEEERSEQEVEEGVLHMLHQLNMLETSWCLRKDAYKFMDEIPIETFWYMNDWAGMMEAHIEKHGEYGDNQLEMQELQEKTWGEEVNFDEVKACEKIQREAIEDSRTGS